MFKNIGIVLKNSPTSGDSSVLNKLIKVLSSKTENIFSIDDVNIDRTKTLNIEEFNLSEIEVNFVNLFLSFDSNNKFWKNIKSSD